MSTIIKVAQDTDDFGENPLEVSRLSRAKARKIQNRSDNSATRSRSFPSGIPLESNQPKERQQAFVERGLYY